MSKNLLSVLSALMVVALLSGYFMPTPAAAQDPTATTAAVVAPTATYPPPGSKGTIVFVPKSTSADLLSAAAQGRPDKANELGYTIDYQGPATEADIAAQVDLVRNVITRKPAGILLAALDSKALIPAGGRGHGRWHPGGYGRTRASTAMCRSTASSPISTPAAPSAPSIWPSCSVRRDWSPTMASRPVRSARGEARASRSHRQVSEHEGADTQWTDCRRHQVDEHHHRRVDRPSRPGGHLQCLRGLRG